MKEMEDGQKEEIIGKYGQEGMGKELRYRCVDV